MSICKEHNISNCSKCYNIQYILEYQKEYRTKNSDKVKARKKKYNSENKEKIKEYQKQYYTENKEDIKEYNKQYYTENKDKIKEHNKQYRVENKEEIKEYKKEYYTENKEDIKEYNNKYEKNKYKMHPAYKLRKNLSISIRMALHSNGSSKNGQSILKYLPYTIEELKQYLELLFEPWMSWENHGKYNIKTWDENDQKTWTWNIDHITPQSHLSYDNMEHPNFNKCWALENLRPYNSKNNIEDNDYRSQEEIIKIKSNIKECLDKLSKI